jgi:hypothetical protein
MSIFVAASNRPWHATESETIIPLPKAFRCCRCRRWPRPRWILADLALRCNNIRICCTANFLGRRSLFRDFLEVRGAAASDIVAATLV